LDAIANSDSPSYLNPFVTTDGLASLLPSVPDQSLDTTDSPSFAGIQIGDILTVTSNGIDCGGYDVTAVNTIAFHDATLQTTAAVFFDQALNSTDSPSFDSLSISNRIRMSGFETLTSTGLFLSDGSNSLIVDVASGITFPDSTIQTTAAVSFDQSLNTTDEVEFIVVQTRGVNFQQGSIFDDLYAGIVFIGSNHNSGNYFDLTAQGVNFYDSSSNLVGGFDIYNGVTFPDGTVQATAATAATAYDQSLNTTDSVQFGFVTTANIQTGDIGVNNIGITFPDNSLQTTAAVSAPDATETVAGKVQLATETETLRGLDENKVVTVRQLREIFRKRRFKQLPVTPWFSNSTGSGATAGTSAFYHSLSGINVVGATGGSTVKNSVGNIFRNTANTSMHMWRWSRGIYAGFSTGRTSRDTAHTIYFSVGPNWSNNVRGELGDVGYTGLGFRGFQVCINGDNIWLVYYNGTNKFSSPQYAVMPAGNSVGFEVSVEYINGTVTGYLNGVAFGTVSGAAIADTYVTANNHGFHVAINTVNYQGNRITIYPQNYYVETEYIE
jgi:hypothetical protein